MARLHNRMKPILNIYRLFGYGFQLNSSKAALTVDALLLLLNLSFSVYGYKHVTFIIRIRMPLIWDISTVISVIKVYIFLLSSPVMMITWQYNRRALTELLYKIDEIMPSVESIPLRPYLWHSATWLITFIFVEFIMFSTLHFYTNFMYFATFEYLLFAVYIMWFMLPLLMYKFLIKLVCRGIRNVNDRIASIGTWRTYRSQWKELSHMAVHSVENEFGVIIVIYVMHSITEVVYFMFTTLYTGYQTYSSGILYYSIYWMTGIMFILFRTIWLFQIIRVSQNCKSEVYKLHIVKHKLSINVSYCILIWL